MADTRLDQPSGFMPDDYDRDLARLDRAQGVTHATPRLIREIPILGVGGSSSYSITTYREEGDLLDVPDKAGKPRRAPATFTAFVEIGKADGLTRVRLPDKVLAAIYGQRDTLTTQAQRRAAKQAAATRKASGDYKPPTPPRRKSGKLRGAKGS